MHIATNKKVVISAPKRSFIEKKGWNGILSLFLCVPRGLFDPVWWRNSKWIITIAAKTKGKRKWNEKKRVSVGFCTENPPQTHCTSVFPM
jgi:hypothetical protein